MFTPASTPVIILAEGYFGTPTSKLATGVLRYGQWPVAAVVDSTQAGKRVGEVVPFLAEHPVSGVPVVDNLSTAMALAKPSERPKAVILGTAPIGGGLPEAWLPIIRQGIAEYGLHMINGLHDFLTEDAALVALAKQHGVNLWDVRDPSTYDKGHWWPISQHKPRPEHVKVITMIGSDCSVGKMFSALELAQGARQADIPTEFVATGQTGIVISGAGVPLDRVIGDYMAGYMESCVFEAIDRAGLAPADSVNGSVDALSGSGRLPLWVFVEGQGSLLHPAYSGVTMSLLHGSRPDAMILCHNPAIDTIKGGYKTPIPSLSRLIEIYEAAAAWTDVYPPPTVQGISMNTSALSVADARNVLQQATAETGLPATDPVRFGVGPLIERLRQIWSHAPCS